MAEPAPCRLSNYTKLPTDSVHCIDWSGIIRDGGLDVRLTRPPQHRCDGGPRTDLDLPHDLESVTLVQ